MRVSLLAIIALALLASTAVSCGGSSRGGSAQRRQPPQPSQPVAQFPPLTELQPVLLGEAPALGPLLSGGTRHVDEWTVESEPSSGDPVYEPGDDPFEAHMDRLAAGARVRRSASLRCVAREIARFLNRHDGAFPTQRLTHFLLAACGSSAVEYQIRTGRGETAPTTPLPRLASLATESIDGMAPALTDGRMFGFGLARDGRQVSFVLVSAPASELLPWEPVDGVGEVWIRGRLTTPGHVLVPIVNRGAYGVAPCRAEPVALPDVDVRCPIAEGDETTLVRFDVLSLGRVLGRPAAQLMLRRSASSLPVFRAPRSETAEAEGSAATLVARLNEVRAAAGLAPVRLATRESETHHAAAPHAAAALIARDERVQDVLALALLAGWSVDGGTIRDARQIMDVSVGTTSTADWVSDAIERPTGRASLLAPDAREVGVGVVIVPDPPAVAAVVTSYAFFEGVDHEADAARLLERIDRERGARGLPPVRRIDGLDALATYAAQVSAGRMLPSDALQRGLDAESQRRRRGLRGLQLEAVSLTLAPLPDALFAHRDVSMGVVVAHTRAPGAAWGQYVAYVISDR